MRGYVFEDQYAASGALLTRTKHYYFGIFQPSALPVFNNAYGFYQNWRDGKEYQTDLYHSDGSTVLMKTEENWSQTSPTWFDGSADYAPSNNPRLLETTTTLVDTNQVSKRTFAYDQFGNVTDIYDFDYGVGTPAVVPLRHTHTDYLTTNPVNAEDYTSTSIHIRNLPKQQSVFDGGGIERARTTYEYDDYSTVVNHAPLLPRTGISGFDSGFTTAATRGNITATARYLLNASGSVTGSVSTHQQYDIAGNVVKSIDANGNAIEFYYSDCFGAPNGNAQSHSAPAELSSVGQVSFAFATGAKNALNHLTFTKIDYFTGRSVDVEDSNGVVSSIYSDNDKLDRPTRVIRAAYPANSAKSQVLFVYDDLNRIVYTYNDQNSYDDKVLKSQTIHDGLGRLAETRTYESGTAYIAIQQEYDALGRPHKVSSPFRNNETPEDWTTTAFDALGRTISVTTPDHAVHSTAYSGNRVLVTDQALKQRLSQSDALDRLTDVWEIRTADTATESITFPGHSEVTAGYRTHHTYNALDDLVSVTQQLGTTVTIQTRSFVYDSLERIIAATNPESGAILYQHDNNGNPVVRTDARGVSTHLSYDTLNRPVRRWYNGSISPSSLINNDPALPSGVSASFEVNYSYDAAEVSNSKGRLTSVSSSVSTYSCSGYDALGRILGTTQATDGQAYTMSYVYDLASNIKSQTYPSGRVVVSEYDVAGRLAGVKNQASGVYYVGAAGTDSSNRIQYSAHGVPSQMRLGNGLWEHTNFNSRLQPTQIGLGTSSANSSVLQLDYNYGTTANNGNVVSQTITVPTLAGITGFTATQTYSYDALNRLATAQENSGGSWTQNFSYDRWGNRSFAAGTSSPSPLTASNNPVFNLDNNRIDIAASGQTSFNYDSAGNLTHDATVHAFGYDAENRQTLYDGGATSNGGATYSYDGYGRRVKKVVGGSTIVSTIFVYNVAGHLVAEYSNASPSAPGGTSYLTSDTLGSPRVITGVSQGVKARHDYRPFGEEIAAGTGGRTSGQGYLIDGVRQKFTGYERDGESQLDFAQARYYASDTGRFTSPDPLMESASLTNPLSWNRYSYVLNNPLAYVDPSGMSPQSGTAEDQERKDPPPPVPSIMLILLPAGDLQVVKVNIDLDNASGRYLSEGEAAARSSRNSLGTSLADEFDNRASGGDDRAISGILNLASAGASFSEYSTYRPGMYWRGINGVRYTNMSGRGPNQYTGPRSLAIQNAGAYRALGRVVGVAGMALSVGQGYQAYERGDRPAVVKSAFDTGFGAAGTFGGPWGAAGAGVYFGVDMTIGWEGAMRQTAKHPMIVGVRPSPLLF